MAIPPLGGQGGSRVITVLWIGIGGFIGANARYWLGRATIERWGASFPWGTLAVNLIGSLLIGIILETIALRAVSDPAYRLFLVIGILGGFTTFSSFAAETVALIDEGQWTRALAYVLASNALAISACFVGVWIVRRLA
jgi:CrcB protein